MRRVVILVGVVFCFHCDGPKTTGDGGVSSVAVGSGSAPSAGASASGSSAPAVAAPKEPASYEGLSATKVQLALKKAGWSFGSHAQMGDEWTVEATKGGAEAKVKIVGTKLTVTVKGADGKADPKGALEVKHAMWRAATAPEPFVEVKDKPAAWLKLSLEKKKGIIQIDTKQEKKLLAALEGLGHKVEISGRITEKDKEEAGGKVPQLDIVESTGGFHITLNCHQTEVLQTTAQIAGAGTAIWMAPGERCHILVRYGGDKDRAAKLLKALVTAKDPG